MEGGRRAGRSQLSEDRERQAKLVADRKREGENEDWSPLCYRDIFFPGAALTGHSCQAGHQDGKVGGELLKVFLGIVLLDVSNCPTVRSWFPQCLTPCICLILYTIVQKLAKVRVEP